MELFSFTDYENQFGGLYTSGIVDANVARAVFQFFQNGGSHAYVVGLQPKLLDAAGGVLGTLGGPTGVNFTATVPTQPAGNGMVFTAREPTDRVPMNVSISNLRASSPLPNAPLDMFDVIITYGPRIETFRGVVINGDPSLAPDARINGDTSTLVTVAPPAGNSFGSICCGEYHGRIQHHLAGGLRHHLQPAGLRRRLRGGHLARQGGDLQSAAGPGRRRQSRGERRPDIRRAQARLRHPRSAADRDRRRSRLDRQADEQLSRRARTGRSISRTCSAPTRSPRQPSPKPPSGFVAGIYATTDASRGVWKAPAGLATTLRSTTGPVITGPDE